MKFVDLKCPHCDAVLSDFNGTDTYSCPYCGARLLAEFSENTVKIRNANAEREFKVFQLQHEAREREKAFQREQKSSRFLFGLVMFGMIALILMAIFSTIVEGRKISAPLSSTELCKVQVEEAREILLNAGFENVKETRLEKKPLFKEDGQVSSVSIDGSTKFKSGDKFKKESVIIITYYKETD